MDSKRLNARRKRLGERPIHVDERVTPAKPKVFEKIKPIRPLSDPEPLPENKRCFQCLHRKPVVEGMFRPVVGQSEEMFFCSDCLWLSA